MARILQQKTKYVGVTFLEKENDKIYYIRYRRGGRGSKEIIEPVGKTSKGMTPARANIIRAERISGKELSNKEQREEIKAQKLALESTYTLDRVWAIYAEENAHKAIIKPDKSYIKYLNSIAAIPIPEITKQDIAKLTNFLKFHISEKTNKQLSPQTQKHVLALFRRLLAFAQDKDLCEVPNLRLQMPRVRNEKTEYMNKEQEELYLSLLDNDPNVKTASILKFIFYTGIRKTATLALKWEDVNLEQGYLTLQAENAKNAKTEILPLSDKALEILQGIERTNSPYIFPNEHGQKRKDLRKFAEKIKAKAGLAKDFRPIHGLRHNFASRLINNGADLYAVQKLLTHSSPEMTQRYAHLQMDTLKNLLNKGKE